MNITFDKTDNLRAKITLSIVKEDYQSNLEKSLRTVAHNVQMPGFRPGKVPISLVRKMFSPQAKQEEIDKLVGEKLYGYLDENKINILAHPVADDTHEAQDLAKQDDFTFVFQVALEPEFEISLDTKDKLDYYDVEVPEDRVTETLKNMQQQHGHAEGVDKYQDKDILRGTLAELDAAGNPKEGGIVVDTASLMPTYFKDEAQKKLFDGAEKNQVITFNPTVAYESSEAELSSLLKIKKEEVKDHAGDFSFQISEISRFVPAELNEEFFEKAFGKEAGVSDEASAREKINESIKATLVKNSDYKFFVDLRKYCLKKVGKLEYAEDILKKFLKMNDEDATDEKIDKQYADSIEPLTWGLITNKLVEAYEIKVENADIKRAVAERIRAQFASFGMDVSDEYIENYTNEMLKKRENVERYTQICMNDAITAKMKNVVTLNHKAITTEDFEKMMQEEQK